MLGCTGSPERHSLPFSLEGNERYPPLKHLQLEDCDFGAQDFDGRGSRYGRGVSPPEGYPLWNSYLYEWTWWIQSGTAKRWWELRKLPEKQRNKNNAQLWADAMDWSKLEQLQLESSPGPGFEKHISPLLTRLKELTIRPSCGTHTSQWLLTLRPLRKLVWSDGIDASPTSWKNLLQHHGSTLKILDVHRLGKGRAGPFLTSEQIQQIGELAPNVKKLAIAVERNGSWPTGDLEVIASLPQLEEVEIWMQYASNLGYELQERRLQEYHYNNKTHFKYQNDSPLFQKPLLDHTESTRLWMFMSDASKGKLNKVSFRTGDWTRSWDGPLYSRSWLEGRRIGYDCTRQGYISAYREPDVWERQNERASMRALTPEERRRYNNKLKDEDDIDGLYDQSLPFW